MRAGSPDQVDRRLAAILAADVVGYSRLMGADEEGTHERLRTHFRELIDPKIEEHRGRVVKNTGDGLLAEFASVVDAVRRAVEVRRGMIDRELDIPRGASHPVSHRGKPWRCHRRERRYFRRRGEYCGPARRSSIGVDLTVTRASSSHLCRTARRAGDN
jgi:class 3 adenylate cyclase